MYALTTTLRKLWEDIETYFSLSWEGHAKKGPGARGKPELQRVQEQWRLDQHREQEEALRVPSDLEKELRKRKQRMYECEQEEEKRREELANVHEFVRVKENLLHIQVLTQ